MNHITHSESASCSLCLILCDPMDFSPPGSSVRGILQPRILEWVVIHFSRGSFLTQGWNLGLLHWQAVSLMSEPLIRVAFCPQTDRDCFQMQLPLNIDFQVSESFYFPEPRRPTLSILFVELYFYTISGPGYAYLIFGFAVSSYFVTMICFERVAG